MKNLDILRKISQGMYVLTTQNGGCIVDAVSQVSAGDNPLIAVSVMNKNYTNELMKVNDKFAHSILDEKVNGEIIKTFGFNSARDINKFEKVKTEEVEGVNIISDSISCFLEKLCTSSSITCFSYSLYSFIISSSGSRSKKRSGEHLPERQNAQRKGQPLAVSI